MASQKTNLAIRPPVAVIRVTQVHVYHFKAVWYDVTLSKMASKALGLHLEERGR